MTPIKTQIEIQYTHILDFRERYKAIISPYLKLAEFTINNTDSIQESVVLSFKEEGYRLDIRWDRIVFWCDGKPENIFDSQGPLIHFFEIFEKIKSFDKFGKINFTALISWFVQLIDKTNDDIQSEYIEHYFKNDFSTLTPIKIEDIGIVIELKDGDSRFNFRSGPFKQATDIKKFNLTPLSVENLSKYLNLRGLLIDTSYFDVSKNSNFSLLKRLDQKAKAITEKLIKLNVTNN